MNETPVPARECLEDEGPEAILRWAWDRYGPSVAMSSSFQSQSVPLLHMVSRTVPELPIVFLDTGYHFPETLAFRDRLVEEWGLSLRVARAAMSRPRFVQLHGDDLHRRDPDLCCYINKVEPMRRAVKGLDAWISGVRRDQTATRARARVVERIRDGLVRVHPVLEWTDRDIWTYINRHDLPTHPLLEKGYLSVGCAPCTRPVTDSDDARSGRWSGTGKNECGLHDDLRTRRRDAS